MPPRHVFFSQNCIQKYVKKQPCACCIVCTCFDNFNNELSAISYPENCWCSGERVLMIIFRQRSTPICQSLGYPVIESLCVCVCMLLAGSHSWENFASWHVHGGERRRQYSRVPRRMGDIWYMLLKTKIKEFPSTNPVRLQTPQHAKSVCCQSRSAKSSPRMGAQRPWQASQPLNEAYILVLQKATL